MPVLSAATQLGKRLGEKLVILRFVEVDYGGDVRSDILHVEVCLQHVHHRDHLS